MSTSKTQQSKTYEEAVTARFKVAKVTKGAVMYEELDANGRPTDYRDPGAIIGNLYVRQNSLRRLQEGFPDIIEVTIKSASTPRHGVSR
jgi:hypothetical protein